MKYKQTFSEAYQSMYENAAAREIDAYADKLGRSSMDYTMFKKSAELLKKKDFKSLGKHIHGSDTSPREYVMSVISKKDPTTFKKIYGNQTGFLATMKPIGLKEEDDHEVSMAVGQVRVMKERLDTIMSFLSTKSDDYNIEGWVQSYITSAEETLTTIADYLDKNPKVQNEQKETEAAPEIKKPKKDTAGLEQTIQNLTGQLALMKQKLENEKNKVVKPEPNPETGEVPLTVGVAYKHFKDKKEKEEVKEATKDDKSFKRHMDFLNKQKKDFEKKEKERKAKEKSKKEDVSEKAMSDKEKRIQRAKDMIKYYDAQKKAALKGKNKELAKKMLKNEADLTKSQIKQVHKVADDLPKKDFKDRYGKEKGDAVRFGTATNMVKKKLGMKEDRRLYVETIAGLKKKAEKSGMPYSILKKVYDRGMAAWKSGHRPGASQQQWAFARVNSFVTKSSGTWGGADKDLAKQVRGK